MSDLTNKPIELVEWIDIETVVSRGFEESQTLEFKSGTMISQSKLEQVRDKIAREIVAFANAYGGTLLIGIGEDKGSPPKAAVVETVGPELFETCERVERSVRAVIEPPIAGLAFRPIESPIAHQTGVIVVRVPASNNSPHGFGRPSTGFVRRGTSCEPMGMRDLQSVFWDSRTRQERVLDIRQKHRSDLEKLRDSFNRHQNQVGEWKSGIFIRITAIPQRQLNINLRNIDNWLNVFGHMPQLEYPTMLSFGSLQNMMKPIAHGALAQNDFDRFFIGDDGTVSVQGFERGHEHGSNPNLHIPVHLETLAGRIFVISHRLKQIAKQIDVPTEFDIQILHDGTAAGWKGIYPPHTKLPTILDNIEIGPFLFDQSTSSNSVLSEIDHQIWRGFGLIRQNGDHIDVESFIATT